MKDNLEAVIKREQGRLGLDSAHLSLSYFNDSDWAVVFNGERYAPSNYGDAEFIKRVVEGQAETTDERVKREALEHIALKKKEKKMVKEEEELDKKLDELLETPVTPITPKEEKKEEKLGKRGRPKKIIVDDAP